MLTTTANECPDGPARLKPGACHAELVGELAGAVAGKRGVLAGRRTAAFGDPLSESGHRGWKAADSYGAFVTFGCTLILVKSVHRALSRCPPKGSNLFPMRFR